MAHPDQGIVKNKKAEEQPKDKQRAQTVHATDPDKSVSREATRDGQVIRTSQRPIKRLAGAMRSNWARA